MKKIANDILESNIKKENYNKTRKTVRAVILKDDNAFMLYSKLYNDYTFPGGGLKDDEDHFEALKRELKEEVGAHKVEVIKPLGYLNEYRYGINSKNNVYKQTSYYYLCKIDDIYEPKYVGREKSQGLEMKWININLAIKHNELVNSLRDVNDNYGFETVLIRENKVLKHIIKELI